MFRLCIFIPATVIPSVPVHFINISKHLKTGGVGNTIYILKPFMTHNFFSYYKWFLYNIWKQNMVNKILIAPYEIEYPPSSAHIDIF